jgi:hypothetical protein
LVQQIQGKATPAADPATPATRPAVVAPPAALARPQRPQRLLRTCVASMSQSRVFGLLVAAEAQSRGFYDAPRQAFLGDGQQYNWWIQRTYFPHFEPIADFLHVLCYLYLAAAATDTDTAVSWPRFERWLTACWQGRVRDVLAELAATQARLGRPPPDAGADDPRQRLDDALRYVRNNQRRMDYPRYRQLGLPVTSSLVESLVGEFNARVKGPDKWWNRTAGAEAILQVRAAVLSEDDRLTRYLAERPGQVHRRHQPAQRGAALAPQAKQSRS